MRAKNTFIGICLSLFLITTTQTIYAQDSGGNPPPQEGGGNNNNNSPQEGGGNNDNNPPQEGGGNNNPPQDGGGNNNNPPQEGGGDGNNNNPPQDGDGNNNNPPQESGGNNNNNPPQEGGGNNNNNPPQEGGGNNNNNPPQEGGGDGDNNNNNSPQDGGGNNTAVPPQPIDANSDDIKIKRDEVILIDVLQNDSGEGLSITSITQPEHGAAVIEGNAVRFTPNPGFVGRDKFDYTITDRFGGTDKTKVDIRVDATNIPNVPNLPQNEQNAAENVETVCVRLEEKEESGAELNRKERDLLKQCEKLEDEAENDPDRASTRINKLTHEEVSAQGKAMVEASRLQLNNINHRLKDVRAGAKGVNVKRFNIHTPDGSFSLNAFKLAPNAEAILKHSQLSPTALSVAEEENDLLAHSRWGVFASGEVQIGEQDSTENQSGLDFKTLGVTFGADYRFNSKWIAGLALGYNDHESDFIGDTGNIEMQGQHLSVYGTHYVNEHIYLEGVYKFGRNRYDTKRSLSLDDEDEQFALAKPKGREQSLSVGGGYEFNRDQWTLTSFANLSYTQARIDAYEETASNPEGEGIGNLLVVEKQNIDLLTSSLGAQIVHAKSTDRGIFSTQLAASWLHEFKDNARTIDAVFLSDPGAVSFNVISDEPDRNYFNLSLGLSMILPKGRSGFVQVETRLGETGTRQHTLQSGFRLEF